MGVHVGEACQFLCTLHLLTVLQLSLLDLLETCLRLPLEVLASNLRKIFFFLCKSISDPRLYFLEDSDAKLSQQKCPLIHGSE